ncbi:L,D-transpeptidase family protein [Novosphingobium sp. G106]|uniref:L,D-transpeptidase family protein n=1 Tax=Novosphingobium sp. G106 TaxID=2849500 RepID=UPI001C2CCF01|nr:L,D-transpeptidase family protein [Novosphingobium sp. G106]MBV1691381.1 L,D-transpeptidase family protein [Novosphingobium sp. G106]
MTHFHSPPVAASIFIFSALLLSGASDDRASAATAAPSQSAREDRGTPILPPGALRAAVTDAATRQFYRSNGWQPIWSDAAADAFTRILDARSRHGLDHLDFVQIPTREVSPASREAALTGAALRYAAALAHGVTDPSDLHAIYTIPRPESALDEALAQAVANGTLEAWFSALAPQDDDYFRLSEAYLQARQGAGDINPRLDAAGLIHVGDTDSRVPAIVEQLIGGEYLTREAAMVGQSSDISLYTQQVADAVELLQRDYGIVADGVVGPDTLEVLNLRPGDRARVIAVALERLRWLPRTPPATRIDVNIAAARLSYYRDGLLTDSRRAIVGKPGTETPQLLAPIFRLVANPTWTIPKSIQHGEMAGVSRNYLRRHNMVLRNGWIVQKSGPGNALGLVKFDMDDTYAIYLHDTSAPHLFSRSERHLSHGCVRVEDALGFAQKIAEDEGVGDQWRQARASDKQTFVTLPQQIPVRLIYQNVFIDHDGNVAFRTDPYDWNTPVAKALGFTVASHAKAQAKATDIGP